MKFNLWVLSQGLQRDLRWGKRGEVLGGKVYGKLTILFKYFQDVCMIYTSNFGFRDPINFPRYKLWIWIFLRHEGFRRNWGCKKQAPVMDDEEDEGVEAPGWVGASFGVFFLTDLNMTDMRRKKHAHT